MADEIVLEPAPGLRFTWDGGALRSAAWTQGAIWRLDGDLGDASRLRVLSAVLKSGKVLVLAAVRPAGASGHGEELIGAAIADDDGVSTFDEALLSTEYDGDGSVRRIGLELGREGEDYPVRAAGDTTESRAGDRDGLSVACFELRFRLDGSEGDALYEILDP